MDSFSKTTSFHLNGYVGYYIPTHPLANKAGIVYEHMLKAEEKLGRPLNKGEIVHHKNGDRQDNDLENLMIFKSNSDHSAFHSGADIILEGDVYVALPHPSRRCPLCGEEKDHHAELCLSCYRKVIAKNIPDKDVLSADILLYPMKKIGNKYGVSDNAVRSWCKKYGLPFKKDDIEQFRITYQNKIEVS